MLHKELHHTTKLVVVEDNNAIDRAVTKFRPDIVIIEALWVVPEKFRILHRLHPHVKWWVRNHSSMAFLAYEGCAVKWMLDYPTFPHVKIGCNDRRNQREFELIVQAIDSNPKKVLYLPNYYPPEYHARPKPDHVRLRIGCFGAIRPFKNQLIQAVAAVIYASAVGKPLSFHINGTREECGGDPILKNLRQLFAHLPQHRLVEHHWLSRHHFIELVRRMNLSMQVSYTETFNIVSADAVMNGVPVLVSPEISWVAPRFQVEPNDSVKIATKIGESLRYNGSANRERLRRNGKAAVRAWKLALELV